MYIITDGHLPSRYAHSVNVAKMAQGFFDNGEDVTLLTSWSVPQLLQRLKFGGIPDFYALDKKIKIKLLADISWRFLFSSLGGTSFARRTVNYLLKHPTNFVYCRSFAVTHFAIKAGLPVIIETHTTNYDHLALKKIYSLAREKNFLGLVTIHESIKAEHVQRGVPEEKILVLEDGVDLKEYDIENDRSVWRKKLDLPLDKKIILYSGSLYKEKGIADILLTAGELRQDPDVLFVLVGGSTEQVDEWRHFCRERGIGNARFVGFRKNSQIPQWLKAADVLLMPYNPAVNYQVMDVASTSPIKLFEYMAAGRPIVSTALPVITKILRDRENALLAPPGNVPALAKAVRELLAEPTRAESLAGVAQTEVIEYSWKNRCKKILEKFVEN